MCGVHERAPAGLSRMQKFTRDPGDCSNTVTVMGVDWNLCSNLQVDDVRLPLVTPIIGSNLCGTLNILMACN